MLIHLFRHNYVYVTV